MKIYGRANAWNVRKVLFLAEEIGLEFERLDYGRGFKSVSSPQFLELNPNAFVPVLVDGDVVIWESHAILRYLAAKYAPETYYPPELEKRAIVDQWLDWQLAEVGPPMRALFFQYFLKVGHNYTEKEVAEAENECVKYFTILDAELAKTNRYVANNELTIADCAVGMATHRWLNLDIKRPALRHLAKYYDLLSQRPAFHTSVLIGMP